jgi:hypothetical protein
MMETTSRSGETSVTKGRGLRGSVYLFFVGHNVQLITNI